MQYQYSIYFLDYPVVRSWKHIKQLTSASNGYHMGEHGYCMKRTLFEDADRIPMIISYPGMKTTNTRSQAMVEMIDLYPTLSDLAGISIPSYVAGKSMVPVLKNKSARIRKSALTQVENGYTLRTPEYRYSRWEKGDDGLRELYDRNKDPAEMINLANDPKYKATIKKLDDMLSDRIAKASVPPVGLTVIK